MKGVIVPETMSEEEIKELMSTELDKDVIEQVSTRKVKKRGKGKYHVAVMDYGAKENILRELIKNDCAITVLPCHTSAEEILALNPDGIFLSNGPGDPEDVPEMVAEVKKLIG